MTDSRRGVITAADHPWWRYTGVRLGTMDTPAGNGLRVRLDNGIEAFVLPSEWEEFSDDR